MSDDLIGSKAPRRRARNFRTIAMIIATAMFMEQVDATVLTTALPAMARDFGVTAPSMSVALTSYLLSLAIFIPASGKVADRFGSKNVFRLAIAVFIFGSILCAMAPTLVTFVTARVLQGLGGAMMMPVGRLVLLRSVERRNLVQAMSWLLTPALIGPMVGPPLGGFFVTYLDWRWIFFINVPIGLLGIVLVSLFIEDVKGVKVGHFDLSGMVLSGASLGSLFFGFELSSHSGDGLVSIALLVAGLVLGAAYVRHAKRVKEPILDLSLMQIPNFRLSVIAGSLTRVTQGAQPFLLPLMLQLGFGITAAQSGSITLATAIGSMCMKPVAPPILRRFGFRSTLIANGIISSVGYAVCATFSPAWPFAAIFLTLGLCGFFMSFQFTGYNSIAFDEISSPRMSAASSFYATFQQLMLSVGIAVAATALQGSMVVQGHAQARLSDFSAAFLVVTSISLLSTIWNLRFREDAGSEISGHRPKAEPTPDAPVGEHLDQAKSA